MEKSQRRTKLLSLAELYVVKREAMSFPFFDQEFVDRFCTEFGCFNLDLTKAASWNRPQMETRHFIYDTSKQLSKLNIMLDDHTLTSHRIYEGLIEIYNSRLPWWKRWFGGAL